MAAMKKSTMPNPRGSKTKISSGVSVVNKGGSMKGADQARAENLRAYSAKSSPKALKAANKPAPKKPSTSKMKPAPARGRGGLGGININSLKK